MCSAKIQFTYLMEIVIPLLLFQFFNISSKKVINPRWVRMCLWAGRINKGRPSYVPNNSKTERKRSKHRKVLDIRQISSKGKRMHVKHFIYFIRRVWLKAILVLQTWQAVKDPISVRSWFRRRGEREREKKTCRYVSFWATLFFSSLIWRSFLTWIFMGYYKTEITL